MAIIKKNKMSFKCGKFIERYPGHKAADLLREAEAMIDEMENEIEELKENSKTKARLLTQEERDCIGYDAEGIDSPPPPLRRVRVGRASCGGEVMNNRECIENLELMNEHMAGLDKQTIQHAISALAVSDAVAYVAHPHGDGTIVRAGDTMRLSVDEILGVMNAINTLTVTDDAVELAAEAIADAYRKDGHKGSPIAMARAALTAAYPALMRDAERYGFLRDSKNCSMTVSHNDHHTTYRSADDTMNGLQDYYEDVLADERQRMIDSDTIWTLHIYPNTPVGFNVYHAATLDSAIDAAMHARSTT